MAFIFTYFPVLFFVIHDFHVSRTEIFYNAQEGTLECASHIFIDDLELGIQGFDTTRLFLGTEQERSGADSLVFKYISRHGAMTVDGVELSPVWLGKEVSDDLSALWIYYYYKWDGSGELIYLNDVLHEVYDDQKNVIDYKVGDNRSTKLLDRHSFSVNLNVE